MTDITNRYKTTPLLKDLKASDGQMIISLLNPGAFEFNGKKVTCSRKNSQKEGLLSVPI
jgi:hypothetical protein